MECSKNLTIESNWSFWIDRGGTFTDVIAINPDGEIFTKKLLSENPESYKDASLHAICSFLDLDNVSKLVDAKISNVKIGSTVATNALLEHKGEPTVLITTKGLKDVFEIGGQTRNDIFALQVIKSQNLYVDSIDIDEKISVDGRVLIPIYIPKITKQLEDIYKTGINSLAIAFLHSYKFPKHEELVANIARKVGFKQISISSEMHRLIKLIPRGSTAIIDAYLSPVLKKYVNSIASAIIPLNSQQKNKTRLSFMQSSGGLSSYEYFRGKNAILSGPAGGVVGAVITSKLSGYNKIIGFDMGGTSTDVFHYSGTFERTSEAKIAGQEIFTPMLKIHTVAAGGGSILSYDGARLRVGPHSAGANPGPACYRRKGPLTVTDINVLLGKIDPANFPKMFGIYQNEALDKIATKNGFLLFQSKLLKLHKENSLFAKSVESIAEGFLEIAIQHMAQAIRKISIEEGHDLNDYALCGFGGAAGQHSCLIADQLNIKTIIFNPYNSVLSALGIGLADMSTIKQQTIDKVLNIKSIEYSMIITKSLLDSAANELSNQGVSISKQNQNIIAYIRYEGSDSCIGVNFESLVKMENKFIKTHKNRFGFIDPSKKLIIASVSVEVSGGGVKLPNKSFFNPKPQNKRNKIFTKFYSSNSWHKAESIKKKDLFEGQKIIGPAIVYDVNSTIVIEPNWNALCQKDGTIILNRINNSTENKKILSTNCDPVRLELFKNIFKSIAEEMGVVLKNTASSVNIRERLDYSCAIFDSEGNLIGNAHHIPVHLGSMDASVQEVINSNIPINYGDVFISNNPYKGGTHLPDITVVTPVFDSNKNKILFFTASRGHHADIGGITPGSMSPLGNTIEKEGVVISCMKLVSEGVFNTEKIENVLTNNKYPVRSIENNISDLKAQIAANTRGCNSLKELVATFGIAIVFAYMQHIKQNAEDSIRKVIKTLNSGSYEYKMDDNKKVCVNITINKSKGSAIINFSGTSKQQKDNFNAPTPITRAAVLYVFRCLVSDDIPLNAGCLYPITIIIPQGSMLSPSYPAAVAAGNVELSQVIANALFAALKVLGTTQGTMNNLTFGNSNYQYYETICSGAPAGFNFNGVSAVHTHMTNSFLTDPEILESRYPVSLEHFSINKNSGGKGKWTAGDGIIRRIKFLETVECAILSGHRKTPAPGLLGGEDGKLGINKIIRKSSEVEYIDGCFYSLLHPGDCLEIITPTGGGVMKKNNQ